MQASPKLRRGLPSCLQIQDLGDRGRGVVAAQDIVRGTVMTEDPLVCTELHGRGEEPASTRLFCDECLCFIPPMPLRELLTKRRVQTKLEATSTLANTHAYCICGNVYCSRRCQEVAWARHHQIMCATGSDEFVALMKSQIWMGSARFRYVKERTHACVGGVFDVFFVCTIHVFTDAYCDQHIFIHTRILQHFHGDTLYLSTNIATDTLACVCVRVRACVRASVYVCVCVCACVCVYIYM
jgi:hypothetical protein